MVSEAILAACTKTDSKEWTIYSTCVQFVSKATRLN